MSFVVLELSLHDADASSSCATLAPVLCSCEKATRFNSVCRMVEAELRAAGRREAHLSFCLLWLDSRAKRWNICLSDADLARALAAAENPAVLALDVVPAPA